MNQLTRTEETGLTGDGSSHGDVLATAVASITLLPIVWSEVVAFLPLKVSIDGQTVFCNALSLRGPRAAGVGRRHSPDHSFEAATSVPAVAVRQ